MKIFNISTIITILSIIFIFIGCSSGEKGDSGITSLPNFIESVEPSPGAVVSLSKSDNWSQFQPNQTNVVCVDVKSHTLLRDGDNIDIFNNARLTINSSETRLDPEFLFSEGFRILEDGRSGPDHTHFCWKLDFQPGKQQLAIFVWTTTEEEFSYSWEFEVVP